MYKFLLVLLTMTLITACSSESDFDKAMNNGKTALKNHEYSEAIKQFDNALIEEPNDKDAIALYKRAKEELEKEKTSIFISKTKKIYNSLKSFPIEVDNTSIEEAKSLLPQVTKINEDLNKLDGDWKGNGDLVEVVNDLLTATNGLENALTAIIEDIHINFDENTPRAEILKSNDSNVRANLYFNDFEYGLNQYESKIADLQDY